MSNTFFEGCVTALKMLLDVQWIVIRGLSLLDNFSKGFSAKRAGVMVAGMMVLLIWANTASSSTISYWAGYYYQQPAGIAPTRSSHYELACRSVVGTADVSWHWNMKTVKVASNRYDCYRAYTDFYCPTCGNVYIGFTVFVSETCEYGHEGLNCNATCNQPKQMVDDQCVIPEPYLAQKGPSDSCPSTETGNPINFAIGNKFQSETDYQASVNSTLSFTRSYNSLDGLWRHNFSAYIRFVSAQYVSVVMSHGRESFFTVDGATVTPTSTELGVLTKTDTGWQFLSTTNEHFTFDSGGKLTRWTNVRGSVHQFTYAGSKVTVTDNFGNSLSFEENADRQPRTLTAPGIQVAYGYNANKRLISVTRTAGGQSTVRRFHYEDSSNSALLTGITDELGVRYATWRYDAQERAISSEHAGGAEKVGVAYNSDGTVSVTNELGKVAKYSFHVIDGVKRISAVEGQPSANCPNSNSTFTYDERGLLKTKTDNKGNLTTYDYNTRGLEVSRTEASGTSQARTITTEWHPTLFLPVTVTEPDHITTYTYDEQGRQLSQSVTQR
jgi:YD repeat-containing protein